MKWIALTGGLIAVYPFGLFLARHPRLQLGVWTLIGFLPFLAVVDVGLVSYPEWLGDAHGIEINLIDLLVASLFVAQPPSKTPLPFRAVMVAYLCVTVVSVARAPLPMAALFSVWGLLRMYFLFSVLVHAAERMRVPEAVLRGMTLATIYEFILVFWQRFSVAQPSGTFFHQNTLGVAVNLVLMAPAAVVLARKVDWLAAAAPVVGLVTVVLTRSRGALIFYLVGVVLVFLLSLVRGVTRRKVAVAALAAVLALTVLAKGAGRITDRFETAPPESMEGRYDLERAASMMLQENFLGVGLNHFTWAMLNRGYADRAGIGYEGNRYAIVHNLYWLTAAEMGYVGLIAFLGLTLHPLVRAFRYGVVTRGDTRGDVIMGLGVGLLLYCLHGWLEWLGRSTSIQYLYWMVVAMVGALTSPWGSRSDSVVPAGRTSRALPRRRRHPPSPPRRVEEEGGSP